MFDENAPYSKLVMTALRDRENRRQIFNFARRRTGGVEANAKDLVQNTLMRVLNAKDSPWPSDRVPFVTHMIRGMRQQWHRQMRNLWARLEVVDSDLAYDEKLPSEAPGPETELERRREVALWQSLLQTVLAEIGDEHPRARALCELGARGVDLPADQARELGCTVDEVKAALKVLRYHGQRAMEAWEDAERQRMAEVRSAGLAPKEAVL